MASVRVGKRWLADSGAWGDLQWSTTHRGGCEAASWRMDSTKRLPFKPGDVVEVMQTGVLVFAGTLLEPDGDTLHARGLHYQAQRAQAVDGAGTPTNVPDTAIGAASGRGLLSGWRHYVSFSTSTFGTPTGPQTLGQLLDAWAESVGKVWRVDGYRVLAAFTPPTTPKWRVAPGSAQLTVAEDSYVTTLFGRYQSAVGTYATVSATDAAAAKKFGPREEWIDLTSIGILSAAQATSIVTNRLAMGAARPGWANGLDLARHEITTLGGSPAQLAAIRGGDLIRIDGQFDPTALKGMPGYIDVIADEVSYVDGADTVQIKPLGLQARTLSDVLTLAVAA